jgi:hypothetical protein
MSKDTDDYGSYNEALHRAEYLEKVFITFVAVEPAPLEENGRWFVVLPAGYDSSRDLMGRSVPGLAEAPLPPPAHEEVESEHQMPYDTENEEVDAILEELDSDRDNWSSSSEDGWFYPDEGDGTDIAGYSDSDDY